jgi:hypothetical protein
VNTIKDEWESYKTEVLPIDAPPIQIKECRMAFYAGVHSALMFNVRIVATLDEEAATRLLQSWHDESLAFAKSVLNDG